MIAGRTLTADGATRGLAALTEELHVAAIFLYSLEQERWFCHSFKASLPAPAWSSTARVTRATKKTAERIDRMPEDSLHEIDGIATEQGKKRLPD